MPLSLDGVVRHYPEWEHVGSVTPFFVCLMPIRWV